MRYRTRLAVSALLLLAACGNDGGGDSSPRPFECAYACSGTNCPEIIVEPVADLLRTAAIVDGILFYGHSGLLAWRSLASGESAVIGLPDSGDALESIWPGVGGAWASKGSTTYRVSTSMGSEALGGDFAKIASYNGSTYGVRDGQLVQFEQGEFVLVGAGISASDVAVGHAGVFLASEGALYRIEGTQLSERLAEVTDLDLSLAVGPSTVAYHERGTLYLHDPLAPDGRRVVAEGVTGDVSASDTLLAWVANGNVVAARWDAIEDAQILGTTIGTFVLVDGERVTWGAGDDGTGSVRPCVIVRKGLQPSNE